MRNLMNGTWDLGRAQLLPKAEAAEPERRPSRMSSPMKTATLPRSYQQASTAQKPQVSP